jgi:predicted component of type VI protein secretion system
MNRKETLELLIEIQEAIEHFEKRIDQAEWSNQFGAGWEFITINNKNKHNIEIYIMCIRRLNKRFTKQLNKLK